MPSLPQRFHWHDFRQPSWYHITIECAARGRNVLAKIGDAGAEILPLGEIALRQFRAMVADMGGAVALHALQAMPDHLHALLHVSRPLPRPIGSYIGAFKAAATSAARRQLGLIPRTSIWKPGFDWELKRTPQEVVAMEAKAQTLAKEGAVLVSPAISPAEKRVLAAALRAGGSVIHLECRPIDRFYKPGPLRMAVCGEGRFLALSPLPSRPGRHAPDLRKALAERLNLCAAAIAAE